MTNRSNQEDHCDAPAPAASGPRLVVPGSTKAAASVELAHRGLNGGLSGIRYLICALRNPYHLVLLVTAVLFGLITWNLAAVVLAIGAEALFLGIVPRRRFFRRLVDAELERRERAAEAKARDQLVLQMAAEHRQELTKLDLLVQKTYENVRRQGSAVALALDGGLDLSRLTASYVRIAIAYKASHDLCTMMNRAALEDTIRALESAQSTSSDRTRVLVQRRLSIARKRAECWGRIGHTLEVTTHQLATIAELVHLMHEQSMAPSDSRRMRDEIDQFMKDIEDSEGAMRELADIGGDDLRELQGVELEAAQMASWLDDADVRRFCHGFPTPQSTGRMSQARAMSSGRDRAWR